jgi:hypothetical protein
MRLPIKIVPRISQQVFGLVGGLIVTVSSGATMLARLSANFGPNAVHETAFAATLSILAFLTGLGWTTTTVINLVAQSPFEHLIIDRQGITRCSFFGQRRFSWKELGPVRSTRTGLFRMRGNALKYWIVADAPGAIDGGATGLWALIGATKLRIPAALYLKSSWLVGSMALASDEAANWLESLRQLVRMERLEEEDIPELPDNFSAPIPLYDSPEVAPAPAEMRPPKDARPTKTVAQPAQPAVRRYGRRRESTVER